MTLDRGLSAIADCAPLFLRRGRSIGEGNPTSYSGYAMVFDPENHLTSFTQSGTTHSYTYNGDDQCVSTFQTGATAPTYSIYDGDYPFLQLASDGSVASVSDFGVNGLFAKDGHFYLWDPSGNACQRLTSTGTVEYTRYVDAFGDVTKTDSITDSYGGFGGQWGYVTEGPFYRLGHRFYDPATGRFLTRDPIGYDGGINLYGYVGNDSVNLIDPSGLAPSGPPPSSAGPPPTAGPNGETLSRPAHWHDVDADHPEAHWDIHIEPDHTSVDPKDHAIRQFRNYPKDGRWEEKVKSFNKIAERRKICAEQTLDALEKQRGGRYAKALRIKAFNIILDNLGKGILTTLQDLDSQLFIFDNLPVFSPYELFHQGNQFQGTHGMS